MFRHRRPIIVRYVCVVLIVAAGSCDRSDELPEHLRRKEAEPAAHLSTNHLANVQADRRFSIPKIAFVVFTSPGGGLDAFSLASAGAGPDGARLVFGVQRSATSIDELAQAPIPLAPGGPRWLPGGSGVFTPTATYKPKSATLTLQQHDESLVRGVIEGEFYRWSMPQAAVAAATTLQVRITFEAALILR